MAEKKTEKAWNIKNAIKSLNRKPSDITDDFLVFCRKCRISPKELYSPKTLLLMAFCHIKNSVFLVIGQFHMYSLNYCA